MLQVKYDMTHRTTVNPSVSRATDSLAMQKSNVLLAPVILAGVLGTLSAFLVGSPLAFLEPKTIGRIPWGSRKPTKPTPLMRYSPAYPPSHCCMTDSMAEKTASFMSRPSFFSGPSVLVSASAKMLSKSSESESVLTCLCRYVLPLPSMLTLMLILVSSR